MFIRITIENQGIDLITAETGSDDGAGAEFETEIFHGQF